MLRRARGAVGLGRLDPISRYIFFRRFGVVVVRLRVTSGLLGGEVVRRILEYIRGRRLVVLLGPKGDDAAAVVELSQHFKGRLDVPKFLRVAALVRVRGQYFTMIGPPNDLELLGQVAAGREGRRRVDGAGLEAAGDGLAAAHRLLRVTR